MQKYGVVITRLIHHAKVWCSNYPSFTPCKVWCSDYPPHTPCKSMV